MKKFRAIIIAAIFVAILLFSPIVSGGGLEIKQKIEEQVVLEIWNIDNTPGGKNSRSGFLRSVAITYNKSIKNVYFIVKDIKESSALELLGSGDFPDLISFGTGFGDEIKEYLSGYNGKVNLTDEFITAGEIDGKIYAVPWSFGGYFLVKKGKEFYSYTLPNLSPITALYYSNEYNNIGTFFIEESQNTIEEAYSKLLNGKGNFVATNREVSKILTKVNNNKMELPDIVPLTSYVDNVNAIAITKTCEYENYARLFIELLTSTSTQQKLIDLNLFSPCGIEIYTIEPFNSYEEVKVTRVTNIFTPKEVLQNKDTLAIKAIKGDKSSQDFLNKFYG